jgi:MFS family permease
MKPRLGAGYWKLFTASVTSNLGDGMSAVAYPWLASAVTRDPVQISLIAFARFLPWLLFSLPAGVITDRVDRRRLVAWMDVFRTGLTLAVALVVLAVQSSLPDPAQLAAGEAPAPESATSLLAMLYVTALLFGFAEVLRDNAAQTLMPALVDHSLLETANGRLWGAEMVTNSFVGTPVGGFLAGIALALPFFVDAGSFAVAAVLVFAIGGSFRPQSAEPRASMRAELAEGFRWLWRHRLLRSLAVILGVLNGVGMLAQATYVLFAQEVLGLGAAGFGALLTAFAVGGVVGSLAAARVAKAFGPGPALFATLLGYAVTFPVVAITSEGWVVWAMFVLQSFLALVWNVITVSLRQSLIPDRLLGRVNSVYRFFGWGMIPIGTALGGAVVAMSEALGATRETALRIPFWVAAAVLLVVYLLALPRIGTPQIEEARREAAGEMA